jgi:hypothetical protein
MLAPQDDGCTRPQLVSKQRDNDYFTAFATELNMPLSFVPMLFAATTMTIERLPAMIAYSIDVAAALHFRNCCTVRAMVAAP